MTTTKWHKKALSAAFLSFLCLVLVTNVFLTLWIMAATGFNLDGLPSLKFGSTHLKANGDIFAMKSIFTSRIMDYNGLVIQAFKNLSLVANSGDSSHSSAMLINENEVIMATKRFVIMNSEGKILLSSSPDGTLMTAKKLKTNQVGGIQFSSSIETQNIRAGPSNSLSISSPVGELKLSGPQKLDLTSFAGSINLHGLDAITLRSKSQGKVILNAGSIKMPGLTRSSSNSTGYFTKKSAETYQLCACSDGKLFIAHPSSLCLADYHICSSI